RWRQFMASAPLSAWFGMLVVATYAIVALFAPLVAPHGETQVFPQAFAPWGGLHPLGTDQLGRDLFSRLVYGARNTIGIAFATTMVSFALGTTLGLSAAMQVGWL